MDAKDGAFDHCADAQVVERLAVELPHVAVAILVEALVVEAVDLGYAARLVVTPQQRD